MPRHKFDPEKQESGDPLEPRNGQRAEAAACAVKARSDFYGECNKLDEDGIRDLLTDLLHLCDREKVSVRKVLGLARRGWQAER